MFCVGFELLGGFLLRLLLGVYQVPSTISLLVPVLANAVVIEANILLGFLLGPERGSFTSHEGRWRREPRRDGMELPGRFSLSYRGKKLGRLLVSDLRASDRALY